MSNPGYIRQEEMISIPLKEYVRLQKREALLYALERYGVSASDMYKECRKLINSPFFDDKESHDGK